MDKRWHLLTGDKASIYKLARQSYYAEEQIGFTKDSSDFLHTEHILLIDKNRHIRGIYNGTLQLEVERMIEDMKILLRE
jgi:protein SCO1